VDVDLLTCPVARHRFAWCWAGSPRSSKGSFPPREHARARARALQRVPAEGHQAREACHQGIQAAAPGAHGSREVAFSPRGSFASAPRPAAAAARPALAPTCLARLPRAHGPHLGLRSKALSAIASTVGSNDEEEIVRSWTASWTPPALFTATACRPRSSTGERKSPRGPRERTWRRTAPGKIGTDRPKKENP